MGGYKKAGCSALFTRKKELGMRQGKTIGKAPFILTPLYRESETVKNSALHTAINPKHFYHIKRLFFSQ
jgi:hypothetical protein